ncbi:hypothetical protein SAMN05444004_101331 [Jannaschia faecimaris]|uniref:Uncharacterized protein n=1 Tax=Jannaschia faecimaris TaxID=1244108 RepID=A0A1H3JGW9_9RHOB|nr:hypothetical protein SAMN05444004_101331 [Jannaschia faecimaris]
MAVEGLGERNWIHDEQIKLLHSPKMNLAKPEKFQTDRAKPMTCPQARQGPILSQVFPPGFIPGFPQSCSGP